MIPSMFERYNRAELKPEDYSAAQVVPACLRAERLGLPTRPLRYFFDFETDPPAFAAAPFPEALTFLGLRCTPKLRSKISCR